MDLNIGIEFVVGKLLRWNASFEEAFELFKEDIVSLEEYHKVKYITIKCSNGIFSNLLAEIAFLKRKDKLYCIYLVGDYLDFHSLNESLETVFGKPSKCKKRLCLWKLKKIVVKHYIQEVDFDDREYLLIYVK